MFTFREFRQYLIRERNYISSTCNVLENIDIGSNTHVTQ